MKVLIVTHFYAPEAAPRAFRWTAIAEHWAREGATVHVITTGRGVRPVLENRNGVIVHGIGEELLGKLQRRTGAGGVSASRENRGAKSKRLLPQRMAKAIYNATWRHVFWPDYACLWYWPAQTVAKDLCRAESFDAVITVSHPFTGHLVGLSLKRALPSLRWITDVGDPFSLADTVASNNQWLYRKLNRRVEAAVLNECDEISVTVAGCATVLADIFKAKVAKFHVIPPLLSLPDSADRDATSDFAGRDTIDLVYLGVLYPGLRAPDGLLALFAAMYAKNNALRLHFFGDLKGCEEAFERYRDLLGTAVHLYGPISRAEVAATMAAADVLVNIGNATAHQLPSKLVEYVAAKRPILNIARSTQDTATTFLRHHPAALSLMLENSTPGEGQIDRALDFVRTSPAIETAEWHRLIEPFQLPAVASAIAELVCGNREG